MSGKLHARFWIETALAALSSVLLLITVVSPDWIERMFGAAPDGGSGAVEWGLVAVLAVFTVVFTALGRAEWKAALRSQPDAVLRTHVNNQKG